MNSKVLETIPIRIIMLIPSLALLEEFFSSSKSIEEQRNISNKFIEYLEQIGENKKKLTKYKKYVNMIYSEIINSYIEKDNGTYEYQYLFKDWNTQTYFDSVINESIHIVYTPEFDVKYWFLFRENYNLYKEKKEQYIYEKTKKYLSLMKNYVQKNYLESKEIKTLC